MMGEVKGLDLADRPLGLARVRRGIYLVINYVYALQIYQVNL